MVLNDAATGGEVGIRRRGMLEGCVMWNLLSYPYQLSLHQEVKKIPGQGMAASPKSSVVAALSVLWITKWCSNGPGFLSYFQWELLDPKR